MSVMWVLDASVVVKWFFIDEPLREKAIELQDALVKWPHNFVVPPLFFSEFIDVMARKSGKNIEFVQNSLDIILNLGLPTIFLTSEGLAKTAQFSCEGLSGYDATYLGLARQLNARWVTADSRATKMAPTEIAVELASWRNQPNL